MQNEFKEKISEKEMESLTRRIMKLSDTEMDELWDRAGFRYYTSKEAKQPGEGKYKALINEVAKELQSGFNSASDVIDLLVSESKIETIMLALKDIEARKKVRS
jgi:hypothetical protein